MGIPNGNLVKNLPTQCGRLGKKTGRSLKTSQPHGEADESRGVMWLVKNLLTQLWMTEEENWTKESIDEKPPN